ncbi:MAG: helix-turn-helix domain-containing protein [Pseudomonadota bacterium]|nr:helix-turn-helix domain-containing protein [Pseudomonadota bacterium]
MEATYSQAYRSVNRVSLVHSYSRFYKSEGMNLGDRLAERMKARGVSQAGLARAVGVSQPTISAIFNGDTRRPKHLREIAIELETTEAWLLGETDDPDYGAISSNDRDALAEKLGLWLVPEMEMNLAMGSGSFMDVLEQRGVRAFDREWLRGISAGNVGKLFVAQGDGDSMEPTLRDGDVVLIDGSQQAIDRPERIWAISYGGLGMIKRVRSLPDGRHELMSDNQSVRPIVASQGELHILGRVIWIGRRI